MDFVYYYKTSDGIRHDAEISASNRDEVFAALRKRGIRPIKVVVRDDQNTRGRRVGTWMRRTVGVFLSLCIGGFATWVIMHMQLGNGPAASHVEASSDAVALPRPRGQISGFASLDLHSIFQHPSEIYLARYAQPGTCPSAVDVPQGLEEDLIACIKTPIFLLPQDTDDVREVKRIVTGIKNDIALLMASGQGLKDILTWLEERQKMEATYRERILSRSKRNPSSQIEVNRLLRTLGLEEQPLKSMEKE